MMALTLSCLGNFIRLTACDLLAPRTELPAFLYVVDYKMS